MKRERPEAGPRKPLTPKQRAALFAAHGGRCHICGEKIGADEPWDDEHIIDRWISADDSLANRAPAHRIGCHPAKTAEGTRVRSKIKRIIAKQDGTRRPRKAIAKRQNPWPKGRKIQSRPVRRT